MIVYVILITEEAVMVIRLCLAFVIMFSCFSTSSAAGDWDTRAYVGMWRSNLGQSFGEEPFLVRDIEQDSLFLALETENPTWNKFTIGVNFQTPTDFDGTLRQNLEIFEVDASREDLDIYLGFAPFIKSQSLKDFRIFLVYKSLMFEEDDPSTVDIQNDFQIEHTGPGLGLNWFKQLGEKKKFTANATGYYAWLEADASQKTAPDIFYTEPFSFDAPGFLFDIRFSYWIFKLSSLRGDLFASWRWQEFDPEEDLVDVVRVFPDESRNPARRKPPSFETDGLMVGLTLFF